MSTQNKILVFTCLSSRQFSWRSLSLLNESVSVGARWPISDYVLAIDITRSTEAHGVTIARFLNCKFDSKISCHRFSTRWFTGSNISIRWFIGSKNSIRWFRVVKYRLEILLPVKYRLETLLSVIYRLEKLLPVKYRLENLLQ